MTNEQEQDVLVPVSPECKIVFILFSMRDVFGGKLAKNRVMRTSFQQK